MSAENLHLNRTAVRETPDGKMNASAFEFRVVNIIIITVALCFLVVTGLYCLSVCYSRTRQSKRAHVYESAVSGGEPEEAVMVKAVKRSTSFLNPLAFFRRPEAAKDNSRIYYIYANPLPVGLREEEETHSRTGLRTPEQTALSPSLSVQEYPRRPSRGLVLDPPMFYLQL